MLKSRSLRVDVQLGEHDGELELCVVKISQLAPAKEEEEAVVLEYSLVARALTRICPHTNTYFYLHVLFLISKAGGEREAGSCGGGGSEINFAFPSLGPRDE